MKKIQALLSAVFLTGLLAGCASEKAKPLAERGWIGGEYVVSKPNTFLSPLYRSRGEEGNFPKPLLAQQKAGIRVKHLGTNAPARLAGFSTGDLILKINDRPMTRMHDFNQMIDHSEPGATLAIEVYHDGQMTNYNVAVGREKFKTGGNISICLPTVVHGWDLWPNPGFSLVFVGYEPNPGLRRELGSSHEVYIEGWSAYVGFLEVSSGKRVVSQEAVVKRGS